MGMPPTEPADRRPHEDLDDLDAILDGSRPRMAFHLPDGVLRRCQSILDETRPVVARPGAVVRAAGPPRRSFTELDLHQFGELPEEQD
jgi:hypothetical protein